MSQPPPTDDPIAELLGMHADIQPDHYLLEAATYTIGRSPTCQIIVRQGLVSRLHARIERQGPRYVLQDAGSANGTFINGRRISEPHVLMNDDQIGLGAPAPLLRFLDPDPTMMPAQHLRFDERAMTFFLGARALDLAPVQFRLMHHLYLHAGQVCTREDCARAIWGRDYDPGRDAGALDEAFSRLRRQIRLADPTADLITSRRGLGYELGT